MDDDNKGKVKRWLRLALSAGILAFLLYQIDMASLAGIIGDARPALVALALVMIFAENSVVGLVWKVMLAEKGYKIPFTGMMRVIFASDFLGAALPTSMGPDVVKVMGLSRYIKSGSEALSSLMALRATGFGLMFAIAALAAALFSKKLPDEPIMQVITWTLAAIIAAGAAGLVFSGSAMRLAGKVLSERVFEKLSRVRSAFMFYIGRPKALLAAVGGGLLIQLNRIIYMYVIAQALNIQEAPLVSFFVFVPVVTALTMIPVSISGIGVREGGYVYLFSHAGVSAGHAFSLSICGFAVNILYILIAGIIYWATGFPNSEKLKDIKAAIGK